MRICMKNVRGDHKTVTYPPTLFHENSHEYALKT